jgi:7,8-dihydropterin-6-yl-methyl-4-(beta-D-ribofuranosyl)aminobenzene 5'-phosphate synthase
MQNVLRVEGVRVTVLVENWVDILLPDGPGYERTGLLHHFDPGRQTLEAENGFSLLIELYLGGRCEAVVLFDCGLSAEVVAHNAAALGVAMGDIRQIVISHGHLDHHGGLEAVLGLIGHPTPVVVHPLAFEPRYAVMGGGRVAPFYNAPLERRTLEERGARFVLSRDPVPLGPGAITTGEIHLENDFEGAPSSVPPAGHGGGIYQLREGRFGADDVIDELAMAVLVEHEGLVVITGCGHAGVLNTVAQARRVTAEGADLALVMGGFHLGFPGTPPENIAKTVDGLRQLAPRRVVPMHCSGFGCMAQVAEALPDAFVQYSVGTRFEVGRCGPAGEM